MADVVVLDAFDDGRVPAELTTVAFFTAIARVLRPDGVLIANVVDEPGLRYVVRVLAGLRAVFDDVAMIASTDVLRSRRFGNVVLFAGRSPLNIDDLRRELVRQPFSVGVRHGDELDKRIGGARPFDGEDVLPSQEPFRDGWRVR